jgi:hypothetical protein
MCKPNQETKSDPAIIIIILMFITGITGVGSALLASNLKQADTIQKQNELILKMQQNAGDTTINNTTINTRNCTAVVCK